MSNLAPTPLNRDREVRLYTANSTWRNYLQQYAGIPGVNVHPDVLLTLDSDELPFSIENKFEAPFKKFSDQIRGMATTVTAVSAVGGAAGLATLGSFNPWVANMKVFDSADPVKLELTFSFELGKFGLWDAQQEVVNPIANLIALAIPHEMGDLFVRGATKSVAELLVDLVRNFRGVLQSDENNQEGRFASLVRNLVNTTLNTGTDRLFTIAFGNPGNEVLRIPYMYITKANPSYSTRLDENGLPIAGKVQISAEAIKPPAIRDNSSGAFRAGVFIPTIQQQRTR